MLVRHCRTDTATIRSIPNRQLTIPPAAPAPWPGLAHCACTGRILIHMPVHKVQERLQFRSQLSCTNTFTRLRLYHVWPDSGNGRMAALLGPP